jgi:hypothetical protein
MPKPDAYLCPECGCAPVERRLVDDFGWSAGSIIICSNFRCGLSKPLMEGESISHRCDGRNIRDAWDAWVNRITTYGETNHEQVCGEGLQTV